MIVLRPWLMLFTFVSLDDATAQVKELEKQIRANKRRTDKLQEQLDSEQRSHDSSRTSLLVCIFILF